MLVIFKRKIHEFLAAGLLVLLLSMPAGGEDKFDGAVHEAVSANRQNVASQKKIDIIDDRTRQLFSEYQQVAKEVDDLKSYNSQLRDIIRSQDEERDSLNRQIEKIGVTQKRIIPLMQKMIDTLEKFVGLDLPFLLEERRQRVAKLKKNIKRADLSIPEKYRQILEAYQIENDYGRTIEAYRSKTDLSGNGQIVNFLRVGRVGLYYQTLDEQRIGYWDREARAWRELSGGYNRAIKRGIKMARKQIAPELMTIAIKGAERVQ